MALAGAAFAQSRVDKYSTKLAPYVPSPQRSVDRMLEMAKLKTGEKLYDLGSGDGRVVISAAQKYKVKAVGVEISDRLVASTRSQIQRIGLEEYASVVNADLFNVDVTDADVVVIYLMTHANERLRPKLEKSLKPGARVISFDYAVPGWKAAQIDRSDAHGHLIYLYEMPPQKQ